MVIEGPTKAHFGTNIVFQAQCVEPHWLGLLYAKTRQTSLIFCGAFSLFAQNREGARRTVGQIRQKCKETSN